MNKDWINHLIELRARLLRSLVYLAIIFIGLMTMAGDLYHWIAEPLLRLLPQQNAMIATQVAAPFLVPLKLTVITTLFAGMPIIFYQLWAFVAPGLYKHEKRTVPLLLLVSILLFYAGIAFAYFIALPVSFRFFISVIPQGVLMMTDISAYLDFVLSIFFAFGLAFQIPIIIIVCIRTGVISAETLRKQRPYVIIGAFTLGMLLTPPDVFSQTLLAIPMWLLFELGLWIAGKPQRTGLRQPEK